MAASYSAGTLLGVGETLLSGFAGSDGGVISLFQHAFQRLKQHFLEIEVQ
jgi:hypothetical protein